MTIENNSKRQIVLDTETTGMNEFGTHYEGHCIIEIGAVEIIDRRYTGRKLHLYVKPDRSVDPEAIKVHGITDEFLENKPTFPEIAEEFIEFIKGAELIIHNASFDVGFMDYEFRKHNINVVTEDICLVTDTLQMARKMYPGKRNSLDALCLRLNVDNTKRELHGALLDAEILGDVYLAMTGGQTNLFDENETDVNQIVESKIEHEVAIKTPKPVTTTDLKLIKLTLEEQEAHKSYLELINKKSKGNCLWINLSEVKTIH